jgi:hypothetical protein
MRVRRPVFMSAVFLLWGLWGASWSTAAEATRAMQGAEVARLVRESLRQGGPAARGPVADLIERARHEADPALQKMAVSALLKARLPLGRAQKKQILSLVRDPTRGLLPKAPSLPREGTIEVRHYAMHGFYDADLAQLERLGARLRRTADGVEGRLGRVHVVVRETADAILRDLADPKVHMIVGSGHSLFGGFVEQALQQADLQPPGRRKLVALFQCVGTQTLPFLKAMAPLADVITSNTPLYVNEVPKLVGELYDGIARGESYHRLNRRFDRVAAWRGRLVLPNQTATLEHVDFDQNGRLDATQPPEQIEILGPTESAAAQRLMSGVHFLRTMNPYYVEETPGAVFTMAQASIPLQSMGLVEGDGRSVTHIVESDGGPRRIEVRLDSRFTDAPSHFIGAAAVFELQRYLQDNLLGAPRERAKVRALAFATKYLQLIPLSDDAAQAALDRLTAMNGLPGLGLPALRMALMGEHPLEERQVDAVEQLVRTARALAQGR